MSNIEYILNENLSNLGKSEEQKENINIKDTKQKMEILHSLLITELNETPLLSKRTNVASLFSTPEVARILQSRERASALFIPP
jgi:hypothetical protein